MDTKNYLYLFARYFALVLLGINLGLIYYIFTPLTVHISFFFLEKFYDAVLISSNVIFVKGYYATIIPACVAGAAYYFLIILNLTTPMPLKKRVASLFFLIMTFLILNTIRIVVFAYLIFQGYEDFDFAHRASWYFGSTVLVVLIWFANVTIFRIKSIPIYTDVRQIIEDIRRKNA